MCERPWRAPPDGIAVVGGEVHVWRAWLDVGAAEVDALLGTLSQDERERSGRFRFPQDRDRFIVGRGVLRALLARYLGALPGSLAFGYADRGKPYLLGHAGEVLRFNLAHSGELALYAMAHRREVGVDVEPVDRAVSRERIADRFFSPREVAELRALPEASQSAAFFNCWTRKEAYLKATGEGLGIPLDQFDVSLAPGQPAQLLATRHDPGQVDRWTLQALEPAPGYVGAVAAEGADWTLECWDWSGSRLQERV